MGEEDNYETLKRRIDILYPVRVREQEQYVKNLFKYVNDDIAKLELLVKKEFGKVIEKIDLNGAKIIDYDAKYDPKLNNLKIEITRLYLPVKGHTLIPLFASIFDNRLSPEVRELREKYDICSIGCKISGIEYAEDKK